MYASMAGQQQLPAYLQRLAVLLRSLSCKCHQAAVRGCQRLTKNAAHRLHVAQHKQTEGTVGAVQL
jgi:hypothetical protein